MGTYLVCKKRKNHPNIHKDVCIALKCRHLNFRETECNYKTKAERLKDRRVKSDPFLVAD